MHLYLPIPMLAFGVIGVIIWSHLPNFVKNVPSSILFYKGVNEWNTNRFLTDNVPKP